MGDFVKGSRFGTTQASGSTVTAPVDGDYFVVSGTSTITSFNTNGRAVGSKFSVRFSGAAGITHDGSNLILSGATDFLAVAGQVLDFEVIGTNQVREHVRHATIISGVAVSGTPTTGQVPTATGGAAATWQTPSAVAGADGWVAVTDSWAYASATTITVPTDATTIYAVGDKIKLTQSASVKYFVITAVASTVLTVSGGSDYSVANSAISAISYSKMASPQGYPAWFNYALAVTVEGGSWTQGNATLSGRFTVNGRTCIGSAKIIWGSTSVDSSSIRMNFSLPISPSTNLLDEAAMGVGIIVKSGVQAYTAMAIYYLANTAIRVFNAGPASADAVAFGSLFTAATADNWSVGFQYEI